MPTILCRKLLRNIFVNPFTDCIMTTTIQSLVAEGNVERALQELQIFVQSNDHLRSHLRDVINLQNQFNQLQRKEQLNLLSNEQASILTARLNNAILGLTDKIENAEQPIAKVIPKAKARGMGKGVLYFLASTGALTILIVFLALTLGAEEELPVEPEIEDNVIPISDPDPVLLKMKSPEARVQDIMTKQRIIEQQAAKLFTRSEARNQKKHGEKIGKWFEYFDKNWNPVETAPNASYYRLIEYNNGIPIGMVRDYYLSGKPQWIGQLSDLLPDKQEGWCLWYTNEGEPFYLQHYFKGMPNGSKLTFPAANKLALLEEFDNGKLTGYHIFNQGLTKTVFTEVVDFNRKPYYLSEEDNWLVLHDDFRSTAGQWLQQNNDTAFIGYQDAMYLVDNKDENTFWTIFNNRQLNFPEYKDFRIEVNTFWYEGDTNKGFGLVWGGKDINNNNQLLITANGNYGIFERSGGKHFGNYIGSPIVQQKSSNRLKVEKQGDEVKFYLNDRLVQTQPFTNLHDQRLGFFVQGRQKIAFDDIKVFIKG